MAQVFYPVALDLINRAMTDIGAIDPEGGVTPTTLQRTDALQVFNFLVTSWMALGMQVWCQKTGTYALGAGVAQPTVGPGGVINIARPEEITQAWLRDVNSLNDIPIRIISREEYNNLSFKPAAGSPNCLFYDPQYDLPGTNSGASAKGLISLWPVPDAATVAQYDLYFIYTRPIQDFNATSDGLDFPQEWYDPLRWNLALSLGPSYEIPAQKWDRIKIMAKETLDLALSFDREGESVYISPSKEGGHE